MLAGGLLAIAVLVPAAGGPSCRGFYCSVWFPLVVGLGMVIVGLALGLVGRFLWRKRILCVEEVRSNTTSCRVEPDIVGTKPVAARLEEHPDETRWYPNSLPGQRVAQTVPKVGINSRGLKLPGPFGKIREVPWAQVIGPSRQSFGRFWNIYLGERDGSFSMLKYLVVNDQVAQAIASHLGCLHRNMTREDALALGVIERTG